MILRKFSQIQKSAMSFLPGKRPKVSGKSTVPIFTKSNSDLLAPVFQAQARQTHASQWKNWSRNIKLLKIMQARSSSEFTSILPRLFQTFQPWHLSFRFGKSAVSKVWPDSQRVFLLFHCRQGMQSKHSLLISCQS